MPRDLKDIEIRLTCCELRDAQQLPTEISLCSISFSFEYRVGDVDWTPIDHKLLKMSVRLRSMYPMDEVTRTNFWERLGRKWQEISDELLSDDDTDTDVGAYYGEPLDLAQFFRLFDLCQHCGGSKCELAALPLLI